MYFVYILLSQKEPSKTYVGMTRDLQKRLLEHNGLQSGYSKKYAPWILNSYIAFSHEKSAKSFEKYLKSGSGFAFLKKRLIWNQSCEAKAIST